MMPIKMRGILAVAVALSLAGIVVAPTPVAPAPATAVATGQTFATAENAVTALAEALRADRQNVVQRVLGPGSEKVLNSGDKHADAAARRRFLAAYDEHHALLATAPGRMVLQVGNDNWPLPIPLVQAGGRWHFDTPAGAQELVNRRIGRNEIAAIRTALAYVDAQNQYFALTGQSGEAQYARRLASSPGKHDGLYWPAVEGQPDSPLEPLVAQAREEGYPVDLSAGKRRSYQGYFYRILTGQGTSTPEGARDYISHGRMTKGFALVAWPASYGSSGIMSFIVNQDGIVFQKDLGSHTGKIAATMKLFDSDLSWTRVDVVR